MRSVIFSIFVLFALCISSTVSQTCTCPCACTQPSESSITQPSQTESAISQPSQTELATTQSTTDGIGNLTLQFIDIIPAGMTLYVGQSQQFIAEGTYTNIYYNLTVTKDLTKEVQWFFGDGSVINIDQNGTATGLCPGGSTTDVAAYYQPMDMYGFSAYAEVTPAEPGECATRWSSFFSKLFGK